MYSSCPVHSFILTPANGKGQDTCLSGYLMHLTSSHCADFLFCMTGFQASGTTQSLDIQTHGSALCEISSQQRLHAPEFVSFADHDDNITGAENLICTRIVNHLARFSFDSNDNYTKVLPQLTAHDSFSRKR